MAPAMPVESREQRWADTLIDACRSDDEQVIVLAHWIASVPIGEADDEQAQLRAEAEQRRRYIAQVHSANRTMTALNDELAAERDRARDLAAHLREADDFEPPEDRNGWETIEKLRVAMDLNWGVSSSFPWPLVGFLLDEAELAERTRAALAAHLEAELAEETGE